MQRRATILEYGEVGAMLCPSRGEDGGTPALQIKSGQYNDIVFFKDHVSKAVARSFYGGHVEASEDDAQIFAEALGHGHQFA